MTAAHPTSDARNEFDVVIPLHRGFRFVHEPLSELSDGDAERFVGRADFMEQVRRRIQRSRGGAFLLTGYRGVGKTSFVNRLLRDIDKANQQGDEWELVDVRLNLARAVKPIQLLHHVIRSLHVRLEEKQLIDRLEPRVRKQLRLAFDRTSLKIALKSRTNLEAAPGGAWLSGMGMKGSLERARELEFLAYDDCSAEQDLIRLARDLSGARIDHEPRRWVRILQKLTRTKPRTKSLQIVFVFDELDKIAVDKAGRSPVAGLIALFKNLLTTSGITFVFVAGKELEDLLQEDLFRGDSIFESVFSFNGYLPLLWDSAAPIVDRLVRDSQSAEKSREATQARPGTALPISEIRNSSGVPDGWMGHDGFDPLGVYRDFKRYIAFQGRGIPRRLLRAFNGHVHWHGDEAFLGFSRTEYRRIRFFSEVELVVREVVDEIVSDNARTVTSAQRDHRRLALYYLLDWMIRKGNEFFTQREAVLACNQLSARIALDESVAGDVISLLIQRLVDRQVLELAESKGGSVVINNVQPEARYRLRQERVHQIGDRFVEFEERTIFPDPVLGTGHSVAGFEVRGLIARGGMGMIYRAWDPRARREVAVKLLLPYLAGEASATARFRREGRLLDRLRIPGHRAVVSYLAGDLEASTPYIVMELIDGMPLTNALRRRQTPWRIAVAIAREVASACAYVHDKGAVRLDIKPHNILLEKSGRVVVIDFGIAHVVPNTENLTQSGVIGTPNYMAPEQFRGLAVDRRTDVFAVGIVLYEMLTGALPFPRVAPESLQSVDAKSVSDSFPTPLPLGVEVPAQVASAVERCLSPEPEGRFENMNELLVALPTEVASAQEIAQWSAAAAAEEIAVAPAHTHAAPAPTLGTMSSKGPAISHAAAAHGPRLLCVEGPVEGSSWPLEKELIAIGRGPVEIQIDHESISRRHAQVRRVVRPNGELVFVLEDLGSKNGTFVNGVMVRRPVRLEDGQSIRMGQIVLGFSNPQEAPSRSKLVA